MFAAITVRVSVNQSMSPAINVCDFGRLQIGYSNCKKVLRAIYVCVFEDSVCAKI